MLRTILVGVDPSEFSTSAFDLGVRWAQQANAMLVGIGVVDRLGICGNQDTMPIDIQLLGSRRSATLMTQATTDVDKCLGRFTIRCAEASVACKVLEDVGNPYDRIEIESQRYDLIMLGQETHFRFETQMSEDDTLKRLLKSSPRPVVIAPPQSTRWRDECVLFCCDGSAKASRALKSFVELGLAKDLPVTVLSIDQTQLSAAKNAERAVDYLLLHGIKASALPVESFLFPSEIILRQAKILHAGLIVMGARSHTVLTEFLLGSVTRAVIRDTVLPVLLDH